MELTIHVKQGGLTTARQAAAVAERMAGFQAQVLLRRGDITVNAKSLLGLLSLGLAEGTAVTVIARGEDDAQAVCALSGLLGA